MAYVGIENENEFYSDYFFAESLPNQVKATVKAWERDDVAEGGNGILKSLTDFGKTYFDQVAACQAEASLEERLMAERELNVSLLRVLGLPYETSLGVRYVKSFRPLGDESFPLPWVGGFNNEGDVRRPYLWIFEASSLDEHEAVTDPLAMRVSDLQLHNPDDPLSMQALPASQRKALSYPWAKLIERVMFSAQVMPRWVLLVNPQEWVLIDRIKYSHRSVLRFKWPEIFAKRDPKVLELVAGLLSGRAFQKLSGSVLLEVVDEAAHKDAYGVSESLKKALRLAIERLGNEAGDQLEARGNGFVKNDDAAQQLTKECLRYMYRILFLLFVESRADLKYAPVGDPYYQSGYSFESLRDLELVELVDEEDRQGHFFHDSIDKLISFYAKGTPDFEAIRALKASEKSDRFSMGQAEEFTIEPLLGYLFDMNRTPLLNQVRFSNQTLQEVIALMSLTQYGSGKKGRKTGRISYAHLGINQLGAVYEALLSYQGFFATEDLFEVRRPGDSAEDEFESAFFITQSELDGYHENEKVYLTNAHGEKELKRYVKGSFIYRLTGREREKTASYYTPELLTQAVVRYALQTYEETVLKPLPTDQARADKIRNIRICEPAMGSAAFLNEAINQLAVLYMTYAQKAQNERLEQEAYVKALQRVKMYLADNCVFGVDLNPVAVELAEVSLWLNAISDDKFIPWFGMQLKAGNSLVGCARKVYRASDFNAKNAWLKKQPQDVTFEELPKGAIWQFLLPHPNMANYDDKVIKSVYKDKLKTLNERRKAFIQTPFSEAEVKNLVTLSQAIEDYWNTLVLELRVLREKTTDPYPIYGYAEQTGKPLFTYEEKNLLVDAIRRGTGDEQSGAWMRLELIMNYWCALWFWPIEHAEKFPTREEFLLDAASILTSAFYNSGFSLVQEMQQSLFDENKPSLIQSLKEDERGRICEENLMLMHSNLAIVQEVAKRNQFFHWTLAYADFFLPSAFKGANCEHTPGFDLTFGNPPWRIVSWNSSAVASDFLPYIATRDMNAAKVDTELLSIQADGYSLLAQTLGLEQAWRTEYESTAGQQNFFNAEEVYPELKGSSSNLFKVFLPLSWRHSGPQGIQGFLHPPTSLTDTKGIALRKASYHRLKLVASFLNELKFFDIASGKPYMIGIYRPWQEKVDFKAIVNVFHPKTIEESLNDRDGLGIVEGTKDSQGNWNLKGHKDRLIHMTQERLEAITHIFNDDMEAPILPAIHSEDVMRILEKFSHLKRRVKHLGNDYLNARLWDETRDRKSGTIRELPGNATVVPGKGEPIILNGPHISVGNPFYKVPNNPCHNNADWSNIDLLEIPEEFTPRVKYVRACSEAEYQARQPKCPWDQKPFDQHWHLSFKNYVDITTERTLTAALYPEGMGHIHKVSSIALKDERYLPLLAASFSSLIFDFYVRTIGKSDLLPTLISSLPWLEFGAREKALVARVIGLNCLTKAYAPMWSEFFDESMAQDHWCSGKVPAKFIRWTRDWHPDFALRTDLERRQALLEIDVLVAQVMGLTLDELIAMYRLGFPVMKSYEDGTWYDSRGRIIYTRNVLGLRGVGVPAKAKVSDKSDGIIYEKNGELQEAGLGFDSIQNMPEGIVEKTFWDRALNDPPVRRTIEYRAPFLPRNRIEDYQEAWETFNVKYGVVDAQELQAFEPPVLTELKAKASKAKSKVAKTTKKATDHAIEKDTVQATLDF